MNDMGLKVEKILLKLTNCSEGCGIDPDAAKEAKVAILKIFKEMVPEEKVNHAGVNVGWNYCRQSMLSRIEEMRNGA